MLPLGEIEQIWRYPVKSFAGERLESCRIETYGLYGDRSHAFIDETKEGWSRYFFARQIPVMLRYRARLIGEGTEREFPPVEIMAPDGRTLGWDERLLRDMQAHSRQNMSMIRYGPLHPDLLAVDAGSLLIVTDASLRKLEHLWGKKPDPRRFRANVVVSLAENALTENGWIGKRLRMGDAELQVDDWCERCKMIAIDPDTLEYDASLLKTVHEEMDGRFGVYASVKKTGPIRVGDQVYVVD